MQVQRNGAVLPLAAGLRLRAGENVAISNAKRGWSAKSVFVGRWALTMRSDSGNDSSTG